MIEARGSEEQQLPHSVEAEQAVLGGLMLTNDSFDTVASVISEKDFFRTRSPVDLSDHAISFWRQQAAGRYYPF